jgi:beta-N-acetylhexosaminidase
MVLRASPAVSALGRDIGSMLIFGFDGTSPGSRSAQALASALKMGWAGGVVFLSHNVGTRAQVTALTQLFRDSADQPLLALDQEGGEVQRLSADQGFTRLPRARAVAARMTPDDACDLYGRAGRELSDAGFNLNLAPVVDLDQARNPIIGEWGRAFSAHPPTVVRYASACIDGFSAAGILTSIKHFPGHGFSRGDTHDGPVDITSTWKLAELVPFAALIRARKARLVMTSHLTHAAYGGVPASLSPLAIRRLLRRRLGFGGVVITDDLEMNAIRRVAAPEEAIIRAVQAGNDLLLISNTARHDADLPRRAVNWIARAVVDGRIPRTLVTEAAIRIRRAKLSLAASETAAASVPDAD